MNSKKYTQLLNTANIPTSFTNRTLLENIDNFNELYICVGNFYNVQGSEYIPVDVFKQLYESGTKLMIQTPTNVFSMYFVNSTTVAVSIANTDANSRIRIYGR